MAKTVEEIQTRLKTVGLYSGDVDGLAGKLTSKAVVAFQASKGLPETGKVDPTTLAAMFPGEYVPQTNPTTIKGKLADYVLNLVKSKTAWVTATLTAALVAWVNTKFGFTVSPEIANLVSTGIGVALAALVGILQTAFNSPHMTTKQPAVVQQPAEHK